MSCIIGYVKSDFGKICFFFFETHLYLVKFVYEIKFTWREVTTNQQIIPKHLVWGI